MSIIDNKSQYNAALEKAYQEYPFKKLYHKKPNECHHNFNFIVYCDNGDWDIARYILLRN